MSRPSPPTLLYLYGFFTLGAIVLMAISLGTSHWITNEIDGTDYAHSGLFESCNIKLDKCYTLSDLKNKKSPGADEVYDIIEKIQGLCISSLLLDAVAMVVMGFVVFLLKMKPKSRTLGFIAMGIHLVAAVLAVAGVAKFIDETGTPPISHKYSWYFDYSLYLAAGCAPFSFGAAVCAIFAVNQMWTLANPATPPQVFGAPVGQVMYAPAPSQPYPNMGNQPYPNQPYPNMGNQPYPNMGNQPNTVYNQGAYIAPNQPMMYNTAPAAPAAQPTGTNQPLNIEKS